MTAVALRMWGDGDLPLLVAANAAAMTEHLGGPEPDDEVQARQERYLRLGREGTAHMFVVEAGGESAGGIGWWPIDRDGGPAVETGWFTLSRMQGRGVARAALALLVEDAVASAPASVLFAFPSVDNAASNAVCRGAGFALLGEETFPFRGSVLRVDVWSLDLDARRAAR